MVGAKYNVAGRGVKHRGQRAVAKSVECAWAAGVEGRPQILGGVLLVYLGARSEQKQGSGPIEWGIVDAVVGAGCQF